MSIINQSAKSLASGPRRHTAVGAAVILALYGASPTGAYGAPTVASLEEIVVTATRREQSVEKVPYNLSVVLADRLEQAGVSDLADLTRQVPGLAMFDYGPRATASVTPIIRGINATGASPARFFRTFEQAPVGTYIGNSPVEGYFQIDDLKQVEVLRGPQGTLYGAGALGGALRLIPNAPELGVWSGAVEGGVTSFAHSGGTGYSGSLMLNAPVGDSLAVRVAAKYEDLPGWIDVWGLLKRSNDSVSGVPLLADPSDLAGSSPIYSRRADYNDQKSLTARVSALWTPSDVVTVEAAVLYNDLEGRGGPIDNPDYRGGPSPIDPAQTLPAGGEYRSIALIDQPFDRETVLTSLDASYDAGFATLASTTSFQTTRGSTISDATHLLVGFGGGFLLPYYAGVPTNPRFVFGYDYDDDAEIFTQELRLVSNASEGQALDYVAGVFYQKQTRDGSWIIAIPGSPQRQEALGCLPECTILVAPGDVSFAQVDRQEFTDKSVFGELTWHFDARGQVTFGVRYFDQEFTSTQSYDAYTFGFSIPPSPRRAPATKTIGKVNPSYEYAPGHLAYAVWSQGFRRGGANALPLDGPFQESPLLATYEADRTDNYEAGLKGRFGGLSYTVAAFEVRWDKPQISSSLPSGNLAVYNADEARSRGMELELSGQAFVEGLTFALGYAYTDAQLTESFSYPANNGLGEIVPDLLTGTKGQALPGTPRNSANAALVYDWEPASGWGATLAVDGMYRDSAPLQLTPPVGANEVQRSSSMVLWTLSASLSHGPWRATLLVENVTDRRAELAQPVQPNQLDDLNNDYTINTPRQVGLRVGYSF